MKTLQSCKYKYRVRAKISLSGDIIEYMPEYRYHLNAIEGGYLDHLMCGLRVIWYPMESCKTLEEAFRFIKANIHKDNANGYKYKIMDLSNIADV